MLSGALTESPAIGTATEAINSLPLAEAERAASSSHVAVADAICYVFGALGVIVFCSDDRPAPARHRPRQEARAAGGRARHRPRARPASSRRGVPFEMRAYRVARRQRRRSARRSRAPSAMMPDARLFIERIRRDGAFSTPHRGHVAAGRRRRRADSGAARCWSKCSARAPLARSRTASCSTSRSPRTTCSSPAASRADARSREIAASDLPLRSVFLRRISRDRHGAFRSAPGTVLERGDVVRADRPAARGGARGGGDRRHRSTAVADHRFRRARARHLHRARCSGVAVVVPLGAMRIPLGTSVGHAARRADGRLAALAAAAASAGFPTAPCAR